MTQPISRQQKSSAPWWRQRLFTITIVILGLIAVLVVMNINVVKYETHLATGNTVSLELAPVDPRGFMQGDYMALSYALEDNILDRLNKNVDNYDHSYPASTGYVIVKIDNNNVGHFARLATSNNADKLAANEMPIHYRVRNGSVLLATNAFFFQEGQADAFEAAEYGLFRVNDRSEPLLTDMVDSDFKVIMGVNSEGAKSVENVGRQGSGM